MSRRVLLEARGATYRIGTATLVDAVDLAVHAGEIVALVGPNGAGKSTLCALLAGDLLPGAGTVDVAGRRSTDHRPRDLARLRAVLPQQPRFEFPFSVHDVVTMGRHPHRGVRRDSPADAVDDAALVRAALEATDLVHLADRPVTVLSGGEQLRTALARVLAQDTPVLLLDEPTAALDLRHQQQIMRTCRTRADAGAAVVAVLHDLSLAGAWADRVGVMRGGRMAALGPPAEVLTPAVLEPVFGEPVVVVDHPVLGHPVVVPTVATPPACVAFHPPIPTPHSGGALP